MWKSLFHVEHGDGSLAYFGAVQIGVGVRAEWLGGWQCSTWNIGLFGCPVECYKLLGYGSRDQDSCIDRCEFGYIY